MKKLIVCTVYGLHGCIMIYAILVTYVIVYTVLEILSVSFILFRFLPMGDFIPANTTIFVENECSSQIQPMQSASDILSAQIGLRTGNATLNASKNSVRFQAENFVKMNFTFPNTDNDSLYLCVFWNFSDP